MLSPGIIEERVYWLRMMSRCSVRREWILAGDVEELLSSSPPWPEIGVPGFDAAGGDFEPLRVSIVGEGIWGI